MKSNKRKIIIACVVLVVLAITAVMGKKQYDAYQEKIKQETIQATKEKIEQEYQTFTKEEDNQQKLELLKKFEQETVEYKKADPSYEECQKKYDTTLDEMKVYFVDKYDQAIADAENEVGDLESFEDKERLEELASDLADLEAEINQGKEDYATIDDEKLNEYTEEISTLITSYNNRIAAIEQAEKEAAEKAAAEKAAKEVAEKKAAEEKAKKEAEAKAVAAGNSSKDNSTSQASGSSSSGENQAAGGVASGSASQAAGSSSGNNASGNATSGSSSDSGASSSGTEHYTNTDIYGNTFEFDRNGDTITDSDGNTYDMSEWYN